MMNAQIEAPVVPATLSLISEAHADDVRELRGYSWGDGSNAGVTEYPLNLNVGEGSITGAIEDKPPWYPFARMCGLLIAELMEADPGALSRVEAQLASEGLNPGYIGDQTSVQETGSADPDGLLPLRVNDLGLFGKRWWEVDNPPRNNVALGK